MMFCSATLKVAMRLRPGCIRIASFPWGGGGGVERVFRETIYSSNAVATHVDMEIVGPEESAPALGADMGLAHMCLLMPGQEQ